jgi:hypothetical protein
VRAVRRLIVIAIAGGVHALALAAPPSCPVPGDVIWWIADDCMGKLETDDEIAASACIERESKRRFATACVAKRHYKRSLCRRARPPGMCRACRPASPIRPSWAAPSGIAAWAGELARGTYARIRAGASRRGDRYPA